MYEKGLTLHIISHHSTEVALKKSRDLFDLTDRLLAEDVHALALSGQEITVSEDNEAQQALWAWAFQQANQMQVKDAHSLDLPKDESWMERLWAWADENGVDDQTLPRDRDKLTNLTNLGLSSNNLTSLPADIGQLTNLTQLYLRENQLTSLPAEIGLLNELEYLDISNNYFDHEAISNIKRWLPNCKIEGENNQKDNWIGRLWTWADENNASDKLPKNQEVLSEITTLELSFCSFTQLPSEIGNLQKLIRLDVSFNRLTSLPDTIGQLTQLVELDLGMNQLTSLPAEIGQLIKLKELYIGGNKITSLPVELYQLRNLTWIDLSGNPLRQKDIIRLEYYLPNCQYRGQVEEQDFEEQEDENFVSYGNLEMPDGLLIDARNIIETYSIDTRLYLRCRYSEDIMFADYDEEYEASEDSDYYNRVIQNPQAAVFLIENEGQLKAYPKDTEEYILLSILSLNNHYHANYPEYLDDDDIP